MGLITDEGTTLFAYPSPTCDFQTLGSRVRKPWRSYLSSPTSLNIFSSGSALLLWLRRHIYVLKNLFHKVEQTIEKNIAVLPTPSPGPRAPFSEATYFIRIFAEVTSAEHC